MFNTEENGNSERFLKTINNHEVCDILFCIISKPISRFTFVLFFYCLHIMMTAPVFFAFICFSPTPLGVSVWLWRCFICVASVSLKRLRKLLGGPEFFSNLSAEIQAIELLRLFKLFHSKLQRWCRATIDTLFLTTRRSKLSDFITCMEITSPTGFVVFLLLDYYIRRCLKGWIFNALIQRKLAFLKDERLCSKT